MVPIRVITEMFGGTADWNEETKEVTLTIDGKVIKMTVGVVLEEYGTAPAIISDKTFVPGKICGRRARRRNKLGRCNKDS